MMTATAAWLYDSGHPAREASNVAKYAAAEAAVGAVDHAIQLHGGQWPFGRVRTGPAVGFGPTAANRASQQGDDPQLRGATQPVTAEILLMTAVALDARSGRPPRARVRRWRGNCASPFTASTWTNIECRATDSNRRSLTFVGLIV